MVKKRRRYTREFKAGSRQAGVRVGASAGGGRAGSWALPRMCYTGGSSSWRRGIRRRPSRGMGSGRGRKMKSGSCVRELEQVKQERDFLKKAAAFFARESP